MDRWIRRLVVATASVAVVGISASGSFAAPGEIRFGLPADYPAPDADYVFADLDGGLPDILSLSGSDIGFRSNLGGFGFGPQEYIPMVSSGFLACFIAADLDGDGDQDLVAITTDARLVTRMNLGSRQFGPETNYPLPSDGYGLVAANLDDQPDLDVAVNHVNSGQVSMYSNRGDGTLALSFTMSVGPSPQPWTGSARNIVAGRFDGDDRVDLAVLQHEPGGTFAVLLNRGDGTFGPVNHSPAFPHDHVDVVAGDLDEDGMDDLVVRSRNFFRSFPNDPHDGRLGILKCQGDGTFAAIDSIIGGTGAFFDLLPALGDMDLDGHLDVVAGYYLLPGTVNFDRDYLSVWPGRGDGHFGRARVHLVSYYPSTSAVADLDGDGTLDALCFNGPPDFRRASIFRGRGDGSLDGYRTDWMLGPLPSFLEPGYQPSEFKAAYARVRKDRSPDLLVWRNGTLFWRANRGGGVFDEPVAVASERLLTTADLDDDGREDLIVTSGDSIGVMMTDPDAHWSQPVWYEGGYLVRLGDFDGDGDLDMTSLSSDRRLSFRNGDGTGSFGPLTPTDYLISPPHAGILGSDAGDINGDGRDDLVLCPELAERDTAFVITIRDSGRVDLLASWEIPGFHPFALCRPQPRIAKAGAGRLPNLHVLIDSEATSSGSILSYKRLPDGSFDLVSQTRIGGEGAFPIEVADFDQDGVDDLFVVHGGISYNWGRLLAYHGAADGTLTQVLATSVDAYSRGAVASDLDDDGRPDIAVLPGAYYRVGSVMNRTVVDVTTPTLLSLISADATSDRVRLEWFGAGTEGLRASVERKTRESSWQPRSTIIADWQGRFVFEEHEVNPGTTYAYRLVPSDDSPATSEAWVDVPLRLALALEGVYPNPVSRASQVRFTLPSKARVHIDVIDIQGREVASETFDVSASGRHTRPLPGAARLEPGVYLVRLQTEGRTLARRFAVIR